MKTYVYRIDFATIESVKGLGSDFGWDLFEAKTTDEAIEIFRSYYPKNKYMISDVYRMIGKKSGYDVWKNR